MASQRFYSKRIANITSVPAGFGDYTINIPFIPNFVDVTFYGVKTKMREAEDFIDWELDVAPNGYDLTIYYTTTTARKVRHVVARLPIDPEQTISF
jgi:hypothetical protein